MKITERAYKTISFKLDERNEEEASQGIFSGYAAVFGNVDSGGDIIEPGAFAKCLAEGTERVKILALHNDAWLPIGKPLELREDETGLFIKAKISDTTLGRDVKKLLEDGVLTEMSIGYDPGEHYLDEDGIRHLQEVSLWEVSIVTWAMNDKAVITGYKAADAVQEATAMAEEATRELKEGRKISGTRLKTLKETSESMKSASRVLDALIRDAEDRAQAFDFSHQTKTPAYLRSDNGSEFTAKKLVAWLADLGVSTAFIEPASPWENGYCESFNSRMRDEFLAVETFDSLQEAVILTRRWIDFYNKERPHSALGYRPPAPEAWFASVG